MPSAFYIMTTLLFYFFIVKDFIVCCLITKNQKKFTRNSTTKYALLKNRTILNCKSNDIAYLIRISLLSLLFSLSRCGIPISILILITNPKIKGQLMAKYVPFLAPIRLLVGLHRGIESNIPRNKKQT